jgi:hypothetical protein
MFSCFRPILALAKSANIRKKKNLLKNSIWIEKNTLFDVEFKPVEKSAIKITKKLEAKNSAFLDTHIEFLKKLMILALFTNFEGKRGRND